MIALLSSLLAGCAANCGEQAACEVWRGEYHAFPPTGWDGQSALPVVVHMHGAGGSPENYFDNDAVREAFSDAGVLWVLPRGKRGSWAVFRASLVRRDEVRFIENVIDDVAARWPVDPTRVYASGFSLGGSVASELGCKSERFAAIAPTSGGFWQRSRRRCSSGPIPVMRTHGEADGTWPVEGQTFAPGVSQGAAADEVAFWREHNSCGDASSTEQDPYGEPDADGLFDQISCTTWTDCDAEVRTCLHADGHKRIDGWVAREVDWMLQFERITADP